MVGFREVIVERKMRRAADDPVLSEFTEGWGVGCKCMLQ